MKRISSRMPHESLVVALGILSVLCSCRHGEGQSVPKDGGGLFDGGEAARTPDGPRDDHPSDGRQQDGPPPFVVGSVVAGRQVNSLQAADQSRQLDLLFTIDNSGSMIQEQATLAANIPAFVQALQALPGGLPDLHIAVISSDFGAGRTVQDTCHPDGDAGEFQFRPGCGLDAGQAPFLTVDGRGNKNFTGDLAAVLSCLTRLGTAGCNYEHQLQSIRAALSDVNVENRGFLRKDAYLGIILLTDEDDCSAEPDTTIFDESRPGEALSFRCNALGHLCNDRPLPAEPFSAPLSSCRPYERKDTERTTRLINVEEFVGFIKQLKPGAPDRFVVSAITGWNDDPAAQYRTIVGQRGELDVQPICTSAAAQAAPAVRLKAFVDAFGANGTIQSICDWDLTPALRGIRNLLGFKLGNNCLAAPLLDTDPVREGLQAECHVVDRVPAENGGSFVDQPVAPCGTGQTPCWELVPDAMCPGGQRLRVNRTTSPPPGTLVASSCRGEDSPPHTCGAVPCPVPAVLAGPGEICDINIAVGTRTPPRNQALWRGDDHVCASGLCVRPAQDPEVAKDVDTGALCTITCSRDSDCDGAAARNPSNGFDKRCQHGFVCGAAFETGPLRCQNLCLCKDFLATPPAGHPAPASCPSRP